MELAPGIIVGERFRLDALLGSGAMGSVWTATDLKLPRHVALKVLHADLRSDPELIERFRREAHLLAGVDHPAIVRVLDVLDIIDAEGRTRPCIVMALVPGKTLADVIRLEGPLPLARAITVMRSLLDGLTAAHAARVVHRDLKPQNIMVEDRGAGAVQVRLLDFGIAKIVQEAPTDSSMLATRAGMLLGTPAYMSPEQINSPSLVDARADLWAATVCFFEMLTGKMPFAGRTMPETISKVLSSTRLSACELNPQLPRAVDDFFARALAFDLEARPRDAAALLAALTPLAMGLDRTNPMSADAAAALVASVVGTPRAGTVRYGTPEASPATPSQPATAWPAPAPSTPPVASSTALQAQPAIPRTMLSAPDDALSYRTAQRSNAVMLSADVMALARRPESSLVPGGFGALANPTAGNVIQSVDTDDRALGRRVGLGATLMVVLLGGACVVGIAVLVIAKLLLHWL